MTVAAATQTGGIFHLSAACSLLPSTARTKNEQFIWQPLTKKVKGLAVIATASTSTVYPLSATIAIVTKTVTPSAHFAAKAITAIAAKTVIALAHFVASAIIAIANKTVTPFVDFAPKAIVAILSKTVTPSAHFAPKATAAILTKTVTPLVHLVTSAIAAIHADAVIATGAVSKATSAIVAILTKTVTPFANLAPKAIAAVHTDAVTSNLLIKPSATKLSILAKAVIPAADFAPKAIAAILTKTVTTLADFAANAAISLGSGSGTISYIGRTQTSINGPNSGISSLAVPSGTAAGDFEIVVLSEFFGSGNGTKPPPTTTGWTQLGTTYQSASSAVALYYRFAQSGDATTLSQSSSPLAPGGTTNGYLKAVMRVYRGVNPSTPIDAYAFYPATGGTNTDATSATLAALANTAHANEQEILFWIADGGTITPTNSINDGVGDNTVRDTYDGDLSFTGAGSSVSSQPATATIGNWLGVNLTLIPAGGASVVKLIPFADFAPKAIIAVFADAVGATATAAGTYFVSATIAILTKTVTPKASLASKAIAAILTKTVTTAAHFATSTQAHLTLPKVQTAISLAAHAINAATVTAVHATAMFVTKAIAAIAHVAVIVSGGVFKAVSASLSILSKTVTPLADFSAKAIAAVHADALTSNLLIRPAATLLAILTKTITPLAHFAPKAIAAVHADAVIATGGVFKAVSATVAILTHTLVATAHLSTKVIAAIKADAVTIPALKISINATLQALLTKVQATGVIMVSRSAVAHISALSLQASNFVGALLSASTHIAALALTTNLKIGMKAISAVLTRAVTPQEQVIVRGSSTATIKADAVTPSALAGISKSAIAAIFHQAVTPSTQPKINLAALITALTTKVISSASVLIRPSASLAILTKTLGAIARLQSKATMTIATIATQSHAAFQGIAKSGIVTITVGAASTLAARLTAAISAFFRLIGNAQAPPPPIISGEVISLYLTNTEVCYLILSARGGLIPHAIIFPMQAGEVKILYFPANPPAPFVAVAPVSLTGASLSLTINNLLTGEIKTVAPTPSTTPLTIGQTVYPVGQVAVYQTLSTDFPNSGWYILQLTAVLANGQKLISPEATWQVGAVQ